MNPTQAFFEEEEYIASKVVEVKSDDLVTPEYYLRSVDTTKPRGRNDSPILG